MKFTVPGAVVAGAIGDGPASSTANGNAVIGTTPLAEGDTFHLGSMTKLFTAALIMQLDQERVLSLDDTIDKWFPNAPNGSQITVRMLLQHESGLYEVDFDKVGLVTNQQLIDDVFTKAPIAAPGTEYVYLNAGYLILGRIAELASGENYADMVQTRFIEPLGLTNTYLHGYGTGPEAVKGYDLTCTEGSGSDCLGKPSTPRAVDSSPMWTGAWSAGGMVSTARDQAVWVRALVNGDVVDAQHRELMQTVTPLSSAYFQSAYAKAGVAAVQLGEGAGLTSWDVPGVGTCFGHAGSIPGSNTVGAYCPSADLTIVILADANPAGVTPGYPGLLELAPVMRTSLGG